MDMWFLWSVGVLAYLFGGSGVLGLVAAAVDRRDWGGMARGERWYLTVLIGLIWPMFCVVVGYEATRRALAQWWREHRK